MLDIYIFKNYFILEKIYQFSFQYYNQLCPIYNKSEFILRNGQGDFILIDLNTKNFQTKGKKIRQIGKGLKFKKRDIVKSCLGYYHLLN